VNSPPQHKSSVIRKRRCVCCKRGLGWSAEHLKQWHDEVHRQQESVWRVKNASAETPPTAAAKPSAAVAPPPPPPPQSAAAPPCASTAAAVNPRRKFIVPPLGAPAAAPAAAPTAAPVTQSAMPGALAYMRARDDGQRSAVASAVLDAYAFPGGDVGRPGSVPRGHKRSNEADDTPGTDVVAKPSKRNTTSSSSSKKADVARARPSETSQQFQWASSLRTTTGEHDNPVDRSSMHAGSDTQSFPPHSLTHSGGAFQLQWRLPRGQASQLRRRACTHPSRRLYPSTCTPGHGRSSIPLHLHSTAPPWPPLAPSPLPTRSHPSTTTPLPYGACYPGERRVRRQRPRSRNDAGKRRASPRPSSIASCSRLQPLPSLT